MRFICEVCPTVASHGHTVIIGDYEDWIRHLLSPKHQTEQALVLSRTTYWPDAKWLVRVKNVPDFCEATVELYWDLMNNLSEYGFIEAIYYGNKTDAVLLAMQLYETKKVPTCMKGPCGIQFEIQIVPKVNSQAKNGVLKAGSRSAFGRRRFGHDDGKSFVDVCVETDRTAVGMSAGTGGNSFDDKQTLVRGSVDETDTREIRKPRIKYDRDTMMSLKRVKSLPVRFKEILSFPINIMKLDEFTFGRGQQGIPPRTDGLQGQSLGDPNQLPPPGNPSFASTPCFPKPDGPRRYSNLRVEPAPMDESARIHGNDTAHVSGHGPGQFRGFGARAPRPNGYNQIPRFNRSRTLSGEPEKPWKQDERDGAREGIQEDEW